MHFSLRITDVYSAIACGFFRFASNWGPTPPFLPPDFMSASFEHNTWLSRQIVRVGFGFALLFTGVAHYRTAADFAVSVGNGLGYDWLIGIGTVWGYILPLLMIVGGLSLILNLFTKIGIFSAGLALASIPAGLMLKSAVSGISLGDTMPPAMNAYVWIIVFLFAAKATGSHADSCFCDVGCCCGDSCDCEDCDVEEVKSVKAPTPSMKSTVAAPVKSMPKKAPAKKAAPKKAPVKKAAPKI